MNDIPRVVFDTNILFSSVGWLGNPHRCVQAARHGKCAAITCEAILAELSEKLQIKRSFNAAQALEVTDEIRAFSKLVAIPGLLKVVTDDPDDDAILECAVVGKADYLVSGDRHLLSLGRYQNIQILKAADFLTQLQSRASS